MDSYHDHGWQLENRRNSDFDCEHSYVRNKDEKPWFFNIGFGGGTMAAVHDRFQPPARYMLTHFLINSNFFLVKDPKAQPIVYASPQPGSACASPFTNLDPPA
ncbi:hypothetical protein J2Z31_001150 [Sinorhizobium kostiense]|uniref:Uncharacterized protein n=1 Tax=Sinorhizobium kostiense TaxID=76747 RepID=A0ABS4QXF3_9HYPH|nr:hypothetical protein [Sinorhizobium kostiense]MBP2234660.1 hypothetical protein [Sinorhizobium kostiense]